MDGSIYFFHLIFWGAFFTRKLRKQSSGDAANAPPNEVAAGSTAVARTSSPGKTLLAIFVLMLHGIAFGILYTGIGQVVMSGGRSWRYFELPWEIGALTILLGAAIIAWALYVFESWRLLAKLDAQHKLCTRGVYGFVRHPIYLACDLLAIGSFLWLPTIAIGIGAIAMILTGDLRARREERVLRETFGEEYRRYEGSVKRYLPGIY